jgi:uncharacterized protein (TIGR02099 family)
MEMFRARLNLIGKWTLRLSISVLVLAALLGSVGLMLLPRMVAHRAGLEQLIGGYLHAQVHIDKLEVDWRVWKPILLLNNLSVGDPRRSISSVSFQKASVSLDLLRSVLSRHPVLGHIRLEGVRLMVERTTQRDLHLRVADSTEPLNILQDLASWLFQVRSLELLSAELQVRDAAGAISALQIPDVRLSLNHAEKGWRLDLTARLPEKLGSEFHGTLKLQGDADDPTSWNGDFSIMAKDLLLSSWSTPLEYLRGRTDISMWGDWQAQGGLTLLGRAYLQNPVSPALAEARIPPTLMADLPGVSVDFGCKRDSQGWRWQSDWTGFDRHNRAVLNSSLNLKLSDPGDGKPSRLEAQGSNLRLQDLVTIALPWLSEYQRMLLTDLAPTGTVTAMSIKVSPQHEPQSTILLASGRDTEQDPASRGSMNVDRDWLTEALRTFELEARFSSLSTRVRGFIPGFNGLDGSLSVTEDSGQLDLDSHTTQVNATPPLRVPIVLDTLSGTVRWRLVNQGLYLETPELNFANQNLQAKLQGSLTSLADASSPYLSLQLDYRNVDVEHLRDYLPTAIMHPRLAEWLDSALVSGTVPSGELTIQGRADDFPFDSGGGSFETRFQVQDTILDYSPGWPRLEELEAEISFRNRSFAVKTLSGKILDADIQRAEARIEDLGHAVLEIEGQSRQPSGSLLHFLRSSPLEHKVGDYIGGIEARGDSVLTLNLSIPLDQHSNRVKGTVDFEDTDLNLAVANIAFRRLQGQLSFTETELAARDMRLSLGGESLRLDIDNRNRQTQFILTGKLNPLALLGNPTGDLASLVSGRSPWEAVLAVPRTNSRPLQFDLQLRSDLQGTAIALPPPLGKRAGERQALRATINPSGKGGSWRLKLAYGPKLQGILELSETQGTLCVNRGELRIAAGEAKLPEDPGLSLVAYLPYLDLTHLITDRTQALPTFSWLNTFQIRLDEVSIAQQRFPRVTLQGKNNADLITARLRGESVAGRLSIPATPTRANPIVADLKVLALDSNRQSQANASETPQLNPLAIPPLRLTIRTLTVDGHSLGKLSLLTAPRQNGLELADFNLQSNLFKLSASGDSRVTREGYSSRLLATLHTPDLGKVLKALGYEVALERGQIEARLIADCPGSWFQCSSSSLNGQLSLHVGSGQLPGVHAGVGRVFGLLNLSSLSRRLALDFSDLFQKGLSFDSIEGNFLLEDGNAFTRDLTLKGPSAHIHINGRVGLKDKDYDQIITVIPQMGSSLSLAGAIAGGPVVGAAIFLAENLFRKQLEQATSFQYSMTGSWEAPLINRITVSPSSPPVSSVGDK